MEHATDKSGRACWVPQRGMSGETGPWEPDGFRCTAKPYCKGIYPTEAIWRQRIAIANSIV